MTCFCSKAPEPTPRPDEVQKALEDQVSRVKGRLVKMEPSGANHLSSVVNAFQEANSKLEKSATCAPVVAAHVSYQMRKKLKKQIPPLTPEQRKTIEEATNHCRWLTQRIEEFEASLTASDIKFITKDTPNSLAPLTKTFFSKNKKCTNEEYQKLLTLNNIDYQDTRLLAALIMLKVLQEEGNMQAYLPLLKKTVQQKKIKFSKHILQFLDEVQTALNENPQIEEKKQSVARATATFEEAGIKDIQSFVRLGVQTAPNCLNSINSGLIPLARAFETKKRAQALRQRILGHVRSTGVMPKLIAVPKFKNLKTLGLAFSEQLETEKIATQDQWLKPLYILGDRESFKILSSGRDRRPQTDDDIVFPE